MAKQDKPFRRAKPSVGAKGSAPPKPAPLPSGKEIPSPVHYWSGGHTRHRMIVHLVFCPKYRLRVLEEPLSSRLLAILRRGCEINHWYIHEINVQPDHVHLLLQYSSSERLSDVIQILKGSSARLLRLEFPDLDEFLWGKSFWSVGYFAESVGHRDEASVSRYIRDQRKVVGSEENLELSLDFACQP